jgi:hypothetical protein
VLASASTTENAALSASSAINPDLPSPQRHKDKKMLRNTEDVLELRGKLFHPAMKASAKKDQRLRILLSSVIATIDWILYPERSNKPTEHLIKTVDDLIARNSTSRT